MALIIAQTMAWIYSLFSNFFRREPSGIVEIQCVEAEIQCDVAKIHHHEVEIQHDEAEIQCDEAEIKSYLELIEKIMTSGSCSKPPKFYPSQCKYLENKLDLVVDRAHLFLVPFINRRCTKGCSSKDMARFLDTCKQLYASAELVQSFIQDCCKTSWIQAALSMVNVSEHVSSIGFDLEICSIVFSSIGTIDDSMLSLGEIDELAKHEVEIVQQRTKDDKNLLLERVEALCQSNKSTHMDLVLGKRLLEALRPSLDQEGYYDQDIRTVPQIGALGSGASGVVHRGIWYKSIDVAKKVLYGDNERSQREKMIQARLSHFNVTFLFCYGDEDENHNNTTLLMDLMEGNLFDVIGKRMNRGRIFPFPILVAIDIMLQVGIGMHYVHELGIVYRDLKPQNIFSRHVRRTEFVLAKVGDFGSAKIVERNQTMTPNQGTHQYMAPEMMMFSHIKKNAEKKHYENLEMPYFGVMKDHPYKCDIHSFAMLCFEILTGKQPFFNKLRVGERILGGERPVLPEWCPKELKVLIEKCWSQDVDKRPSFGDICKELRYIKYLLLTTDLEVKENLNLRRPYESNEGNYGSSSEDEIPNDVHGRMHGWDVFGRKIEDELDPFTNSLDDEEMFFESCKLFEDHLKHEQDERINQNADLSSPGFFQNMDDLVLEERIGRGGEADIYGAHGGLIVKVFYKQFIHDFEKNFDMGIVRAFGSDSHHRSPLSLIKGGTLLTDSRVRGQFGIVMERKWGDLRKLVDWHMQRNKESKESENGVEEPPFTEDQVLAMMLGIAKDIKCLHNESPPIMHRDIKSRNILVQGPQLPSLDGGFEVTMCDYGSKDVDGTGFWRAPEILLHLKMRTINEFKFTDKCDVYSYGMVCYELVTGRRPLLEHPPNAYDIILNGGRPILPSDLHPVIKDVIISCWKHEPSERPSFDNIVDMLSLQV